MADSLKQMEKIVKTLFQNNDSYAFRDPVDWKGLGLPDYPKVIKKPMDLGTVRSKLKAGSYHDVQECAEDIRLIWKNCMAYNEDGSEVYLMAERMGQNFEELFSGLDFNRNPSNEERHKFSRDMYKLDPEQLGFLIGQLHNKCAQAIETLETSEELEVNIDVIDASTFWELDKYMRGIIGDDGPPTKKRHGEGRGSKGKKQRSSN
mmetsp:Transcript_3179/g.4077  ORF Transcript_3179/g.4077 Transcript_3179/m.4077 type:complete len:205 (+) Transcript_3179:252-866(+)